MTRSSQTEYERVAGVLEACADAEKRLGGHPYRAKIMRRSAELLRRVDALLRTPRGEGEAGAAWNLRAAHQARDADARRLDTLGARGWALLPPDRNNAIWAVQDGELNTLGTGESARAAIDAAMAADTQTEGDDAE